jgi:serine/threonine protein kinase
LFTNEYSKLDIKIGFPHLFEFGSEHQFNYLVMTMYGPNLIQLMRLCGGKFSARTTLLIALQIIDRLEDIHQKKYLYGGICPENFMVGTGKESYLLYMTDFGKSTIYKSKNKGTHIPYQTTNTYEHSSYDHVFMSVNCQLGVQSSRRDDI